MIFRTHCVDVFDRNISFSRQLVSWCIILLMHCIQQRTLDTVSQDIQLCRRHYGRYGRYQTMAFW